MRKKLLFAALGTALVAGTLTATQISKHPANPPVDAPISQPIDAATVEFRDVVDVYAADAVIEAVHTATVSAQIAGNVTRYYVDAGDRVSARRRHAGGDRTQLRRGALTRRRHRDATARRVG
jgi:multidrug efflux pump subunit AcrA (membrane-fusion protein)